MRGRVRIIRALDWGRKVKARRLKPRIKVIVEPKREPTFTERLEEKVGRVIENSGEQGWTGLAESSVRGEIALTLSQINNVDNLHEKLRRNLLRLECYIDTEIMQRAPKPPHFYDHRIAERDMLRARLLRIEAERRALSIFEERELRQLHTQLWSLLGQHTQVKAIKWK